ncbi:MAG: hypothetical protein LUC34_00855 [Campylobacter sp.]|nr:hypothetical protein [Campylobacter sp.]
MNSVLIENLKRFFEVKECLDRTEQSISELREDKKSYLRTLEKIEIALKQELKTDKLDDLAAVAGDLKNDDELANAFNGTHAIVEKAQNGEI